MSHVAGEYGEFARQVSAVLAALETRLELLEARVARLDTHSAELAGELLDVIGRVDGLELKLGDLDAACVYHLHEEKGVHLTPAAEARLTRLERVLWSLDDAVAAHLGLDVDARD
jgi:hypothetical protein